MASVNLNIYNSCLCRSAEQITDTTEKPLGGGKCNYSSNTIFIIKKDSYFSVHFDETASHHCPIAIELLFCDFWIT